MRLFRLILGVSLVLGTSACSFWTAEPQMVPACQGSVVKGCSPTVYFLFDSDAISRYGQKRLDWAVKKMTRYPRKRVTVAAHTDQIGTEEYNVNLSRRRAENTKKYLISQGIDADLIDVVAYGISQPACTDVHACAYLNRRVVLTIR